MRLKTLLQDYLTIEKNWDCEITGLSLDSHEVKPGDLFIALKGSQTDGRNYIDDAFAKGARAALAEADGGFPEFSQFDLDQEAAFPIFAIKKLPEYLGLIAAKFYGEPSKKMQVIGITGTNGKTSVCHFIAELLRFFGKKVGTIGTLGLGYDKELFANTHTTPHAIEIQKTLAKMLKQKIEYVVMEVSSHALVQGRVNGVNFDYAVFTNLSRDHLDYHGDLDNYAKAKRRLFDMPGLKHAIINFDDSFGRQLRKDLSGKLKIYTYSASGRVNEQNHQIRSSQVNLSLQGITASVHTPWGDGFLRSRLLGRFNLSNLLAALTALCLMEFPFEEILRLMPDLQNVPGRMTLFGGNEHPYVIVDYAHTPDALQQVLKLLREFCENDLWCVFGCGGERDRGKRALMGICAEASADHVVITDDNPRTEDPKQIVADILSGMQQPEFAVVEHDRRRAIAHAIACAQSNDIVLVAGKGHEQYQIIGKEKKPFNDELEIQMLLTETEL